MSTDATSASKPGPAAKSKKLWPWLALLLVIAAAAAASGFLLLGSKSKQGISGEVRAQVCVKGVNYCYFGGVANVFVLLSGSNVYRQAVTDRDGHFSIDVPDGSYFLVVSNGHGKKLSPLTDAIKLKGHTTRTLFLAQP